MPKKFKFSLEKILRYRKEIEDNQVIQLKHNIHELEQNKTQLSNLVNQKNNFLNSNSDKKNLKLNDRKILSDYIGQMSNEIQNHNIEVNKSLRQVEQSRKELENVTKDRKILQNLKEKHFLTHSKEIKMVEEKRNKEIGIQNTYKNKPMGSII